MRKLGMWLGCFVATALLVGGASAGDRLDNLAQDFAQPPDSARAWCYWWWLNGCVTRDGIVRDLDHMKAKGIGGALVFHAGEGETPFQIEFMSSQWRELFKFAVAEAARRQIVIGFNVCGGWNAGGPWVQPDEAAQTLAFRSVEVSGPGMVNLKLPPPEPATNDFYQDIAVLAWRCAANAEGQPPVCERETMTDLTGKLHGDQITWDAPGGSWMVVRFGHYLHPRARTKCTGGKPYLEIDPLRADVLDRHFAATAGVLVKDVKEHAGKTFQFVHIDSGEIGKPDWTPAFRKDFKKRRDYDPFPYLAARAGLIVETRQITERFNEDYERTLGDLMVENYYGRLAKLARRYGLGAHSEAAGFQKPCVDALRSLGVNDICMSEFWVRPSNTNAPDIRQLSEEQLRNHDGIKTAAAAAHTYGRRIVMAEAFTVINRPPGIPNYDKDPFALKDTGDRAFCAGLNRNMLCFMVHQPEETSKPGYDWPRVGTEFSRHVTWWPMGGAWLTYLARCQSLLQAGQFAADVCYFPGEWVPNYVPARWAMNPALPPGYDCDTVNAEILCGESSVGEAGRLRLASGMQYRYLVLNQGGPWRMPRSLTQEFGLPLESNVEHCHQLSMSPATLAQIRKLVQRGMTLVGPPPARAVGLTDYPRSDAEVGRLARELWGTNPGAAGERKAGKGLVIWGKSLIEIFQADSLVPDLVIEEDAASKALSPDTLSGIPNPYGSFDWIHRTIGDMEVYFIANLRNAAAAGEFSFRVSGGKPELWDPVTGNIRALPKFRRERGCTIVPMQFAPRQSFFVVFRETGTASSADCQSAVSRIGNPQAQSSSDALPTTSRQTQQIDNLRYGVASTAKTSEVGTAENFPEITTALELSGPWKVSFDPQWGGPAHATFDQLDDWSKRPQRAIRYYSGKATYTKTFDFPPPATDHSALFLDLGTVKNVAAVRLNGRDLGVVWCAPWRVDVTEAIKPKSNVLEIAVINLWPNRLIGDAPQPPAKRVTKSNVTAFKPRMPLLPSGLLGPVTLKMQEEKP